MRVLKERGRFAAGIPRHRMQHYISGVGHFIRQCSGTRIMLARALACGSVLLSFVVTGAAPAFAQTDDQITEARTKGIRFRKAQQKTDGRWTFGVRDDGSAALCTI